MNNSEALRFTDPAINQPVPEERVSGLARLVRVPAFAALVTVPLMVTPWTADAYNWPKVLVIYALAALMVIGWIVAYVLTEHPRWTITLPELPIWLLLLAVLLSSWISVSPQSTFFGAPGRYEGLLAFLAYMIFYFGGVHFFGSAHGFHALVRTSAAAGLIAACYGVAQVFIPPLFAGEAVAKALYASLGFTRSLSTLGNPVVFGGYLSLVTPLLLGLALATSGRRGTAWFVAAGVGYVATLVTGTRAAWLAVAVATIILVGTVGREALRRHWAALVALMVVVVLGASLTMTVATPSQLASRALSSFAVQSGSLGQRVYIWERTTGLIRSRPFLGWGLATLQDVFPYDRSTMVKQFGYQPVIIDEAHNDILQMAVSIGVPGSAAYVAFWLLVIVAAARIWRRTAGTSRILAAGWLAAIAAYVFQAQFSFSAVAVAPVVWLLAGAACGWEACPHGE